MNPDIQPVNSNAQLLWFRHRKKFIVLLVLVILAVIFRYVATYGFITVQFSGASEERTVIILDQTTNTAVTVQTDQPSLRHFGRKSTYEITAVGSKTSGWQQVASSGFLQNKSVSLATQPEKDRTFVADNPRGCMFYDQQLLSYTCDTNAEGIYVHNQSTPELPPIVTEAFTNIEGSLVAIIGTSQGTVGVFQDQPAEGTAYSYSFMALAPGSFTPQGEARILETPEVGRKYLAKAYQNGILLYDEAMTQLIYYASMSAAPESIKIPAAPDGLVASSLETTPDAIAISYRTPTNVQDNSLEKLPDDARGATAIITKGQSKMFQHKEVWASVMPCGTQKVCAMSSVGEAQQVTVLDASGDELKPDFMINNVSQLASLTGTTLIVTKDGILRLDTQTGSAAFDYRFGDYTFCGLGASQQLNTYVACISSTDGSHALLIHTDQAVSTKIDALANTIRKNKSVDSVVVDRKRIFIVLEYGEGIYSDNADSFVDDDTRISQAENEVNQLLAPMQLASLGYTTEILL